MKVSEMPVLVEANYNAPIEKVWNAITILDEMRKWFFPNIDAFKPQEGAKSNFVVDAGERKFTHLWQVTEVNAPYKLVYNWRYAEYPGDSFVSWELFEENSMTRMVLTAIVVQDFPDEVPEFKRESCLGGWKFFIQEQLKTYVESN